MRTVVVIPARGGSKGIPRKNLRPFGGTPLILWSIRAAKAAKHVDAVIVSTDSLEIAEVARRDDVEVIMRAEELAGDAVTLDPVIYDAVIRYEQDHGLVENVLTVQPTSPLLRANTIDAVAQRLMVSQQFDTILTAIDDTHLAWNMQNGVATPAYEKRANRQSLPKRMKETGGVLATRRSCMTPQTRFGARVGLHEVSAMEGIDIDSAEDWLFAEACLRRRRFAFVTIGTRPRGLGHVTRVMTLVESLSGHLTKIFCRPEEELAIARLQEAFFPVEIVSSEHLEAAIDRFAPDIVVHDELDTAPEVISAERQRGYSVVSFEDSGLGAQHAQLVFNALHPAAESDPTQGRYNGPDAYILRDEFRQLSPAPLRDEIENVLVTFGGTDPSGLTIKVVSALAGHVRARLTVVAGKGFADFESLAQLCEKLRRQGATVELHQDVALMSAIMSEADFAFSSAGRTVYELVHMQVPGIILAQNAQEMRHTFAGPESGCINLGLGSEVSEEAIVAAYMLLALSRPSRAAMRKCMAAIDLTKGRSFVVEKMLNLPIAGRN